MLTHTSNLLNEPNLQKYIAINENRQTAFSSEYFYNIGQAVRCPQSTKKLLKTEKAFMQVEVFIAAQSTRKLNKLNFLHSGLSHLVPLANFA